MTVILPDRQIAQLDSLALRIRERHRRHIAREDVIGAIIEAAEQAGVWGDEAFELIRKYRLTLLT